MVKTPLTQSQLQARRGLAWLACSVVVVALGILLFSGCQMAQWRVFQKKVDGREGEKPAAQVEGEKRAAAYIVARTAPPVADPAGAVEDVHQVATGLSASLGQPEKPVTMADKDAVIASLTAGLKAKDAQLERWRAFGRKYAGTPLEDTGINLAGPAGLVGLLAVIAACVFVPGFGYVLLRLVPVLWGMVKRMAAGIESFTVALPAQGQVLKEAFLSRKMNEVDKQIVKRRKKALRPEEIISAPTPAFSSP